MMTVELLPQVGAFAENKDVARRIRTEVIAPALNEGGEVTLDFEGVGSATQSFVHALISDIIRQFGPEVLDRLYFKNCSEVVKRIVGMVAEYMQEGD